MKSVITAICSAIILVLVVITLSGIGSKSVRQQEIDDALSVSLKQVSDERDAAEIKDVIWTKDQFKDRFMTILKEHMTSEDNSREVTVKFIEIDMANKLYSIEVDETFRYFTGKETTIFARKTVISET